MAIDSETELNLGRRLLLGRCHGLTLPESDTLVTF
jgi:hypothetical protein